jgi:hypothetical protein
VRTDKATRACGGDAKGKMEIKEKRKSKKRKENIGGKKYGKTKRKVKGRVFHPLIHVTHVYSQNIVSYYSYSYYIILIVNYYEFRNLKYVSIVDYSFAER